MTSHCDTSEAPGFTRFSHNGLPIYQLGKEIDFGVCQRLLSSFQEDLDDNCRGIAVDLRQVRSLESAAAWLLVTVQQSMRKRNRRFLILDPQPQVGLTLARAWASLSQPSTN